MREPATITELRRRLTEIGCPAKRTHQIVQEVSEHREDLKQEALEAGRGPEAADSFADSKLGHVETLVRQFTVALRRRSCWGRHPILTFCVLPPIVFFAWFPGIAALVMWGANLLGTGDAITRWFLIHLELVKVVVYSVDYSAFIVVPALLCWLARRYVHDFKWALAGCTLSSLHGLFHVITLTSHNLGWGYGLNPDWFTVATPWLIYGAWRYLAVMESRRYATSQRAEETI